MNETFSEVTRQLYVNLRQDDLSVVFWSAMVASSIGRPGANARNLIIAESRYNRDLTIAVAHYATHEAMYLHQAVLEAGPAIEDAKARGVQIDGQPIQSLDFRPPTPDETVAMAQAEAAKQALINS